MSKRRDWFKWKLRSGRRGTLRRAALRTGNGFEVMGACIAMLDHAREASHWTENPEGVFKTTLEDLSIDYTTPEQRVREVTGALVATGWLDAQPDPATADPDHEIAFRVVRYLAFNDPQGSSSDRQAASRDAAIVEQKAALYRGLLENDADPARLAEVLDLRGNVTTRNNLDGLCTEGEEKREEENNDISSTSAEPKIDHARILFDHWIQATGRHAGQNRLTTGRRSKVNARRRDGYTPDQLKTAIDGIASSPWHSGDNPGSKRYDTFDFIFRSGENVEKGIEFAAGSANREAAATGGIDVEATRRFYLDQGFTEEEIDAQLGKVAS